MPITKANIDELIRFLPEFERPGRRFTEKWDSESKDGAVELPYPVYSPDVTEFFAFASQEWWCDFNYVPATAGEMIENDEIIRTATIDQLKTLLTYCVRGERFCDGHWATVLETGRVQAILRRPRELR